MVEVEKWIKVHRDSKVVEITLFQKFPEDDLTRAT
jgi:hypothetical protein